MKIKLQSKAEHWSLCEVVRCIVNDPRLDVYQRNPNYVSVFAGYAIAGKSARQSALNKAVKELSARGFPVISRIDESDLSPYLLVRRRNQ